MKTNKLPLLILLPLIICGVVFQLLSAETNILWEIGKPDNKNTEFYLAPGGYNKFQEDAFYIIGRSDPKKDFPYVHPGPADGWAGGRQHTFLILFGLKEAPKDGSCVLKLDFIDTQSQIPPRLGVSINGKSYQAQAPKGAGDASVFGDPSKGKEWVWNLSFPANLLKQGLNEIAITTLSGSWVLYDYIALLTPPGLELTDASGTAISLASSQPLLVEKNGKLMQKVQLIIRHLGDEVSGTIRAGDIVSLPVSLKSGAHRIELDIPAVEKEIPLPVSIEANNKKLSEKTVILKPVRKWVVYLLPHSHKDIGYTHVQTDVEKAQWRYLEQAIEAAKKTASYPEGSRFKWNVEVMWSVDSYLEHATPEKVQDFINAVKAGLIGLQALYGNELTGLCNHEELLRLIRVSQEVAKRCGVKLTSAMITDVPGYTWGIVPALVHNGVKYFSAGPNGGDRIGHTIAAWGDKPFWWLAPNRKDKVLFWMTGTGYYQVFSSEQRLLEYLSRLEEKGYPYDYVQVRHCLGDNAPPDVNFADRIRKWNETYAYPKLIIATTDDMFKDFEKRYGNKIPSFAGDFTPYWEDGSVSSALETAMNRESARRLLQAETLYAMLNPEKYTPERFSQAWRNVLLYDEHTWGAHNSISQPDHPFVKSQWAIKRQFAVDADIQSKTLLNEISGNTNPNPTKAIDVINTLPYSQADGFVVVPKELAIGEFLSDSTDGEAKYAGQRLSTGEVVFRIPVEGYGIRRLFFTSKKPAVTATSPLIVEGTTISAKPSGNRKSLIVRINPQTGAISSLRYGEHEFVNPKEQTELNDYFYLPGSDLKNLQRNGKVKISVKENGPLVASLLVESDAPGCRKLVREIRVHAPENIVEIINIVDKLPIREKEGVHFGFGFNVPDGVVRMEIPWAIVRPEEDQLPGSCKNWFTIQQFVDVSNERLGITMVTPDTPLIEVGGITANLIGSLSDTRFWRNKVEPSQTIYVWAMNNHWHTNYRAEQEGKTVFRFYLVPRDGGFDPIGTTQLAQTYCQPLIAVPSRDGALNPSSVILSEKRVVVTARKPSEDKKGEIIRLYNPSNQSLSTKIEWKNKTPKNLWMSNAGEEPIQKVSGQIEIPANSLVTIRADF